MIKKQITLCRKKYTLGEISRENYRVGPASNPLVRKGSTKTIKNDQKTKENNKQVEKDQ